MAAAAGSTVVNTTAVQLVTSPTSVVYGVTVKAAAANSGTVSVGLSSSVTSGTSSPATDGYQLSAGQKIFLPRACVTNGDVSNVYVVASSPSQAVTWVYSGGPAQASPQMVPVSAVVMANGRTLVVTFSGPTPASFGVPDWLPGKAAGRTCGLSGAARLSFRGCSLSSNVPAFAGATYTNATKTVTAPGAFANYVWHAGDQLPIVIATGTGVVSDQAYGIASRVSADQITLTTAMGGNATALASLAMPAGQGTNLTWRAEFWIVDSSSTVDYSAANLTFHCDDGLLYDIFGNASAGTASLAVTNNSLVDAGTGFTTAAGFTRGSGGVTFYVCPVFGSDANTFAQAQSQSTPVATINKAGALAVANSQNGKGCRIAVLQGTSHTSTIQVKVSGASRLQPTLIESYWDGGISGQGIAGVRPIISGAGGAAITTVGGGGSPADVSLIVVRGLELVGTNAASSVSIFRSFGSAGYGAVFDDCVTRNGLDGFVFQNDFNSGNSLMQNCAIMRCVVKDVYSTSGGHTAGIYTYGVDNFLASECHFEFTGRQAADGSQSDIFSRAMYLDSESGPNTVVGCYISRSDGTQNRSGGSITGSVYTQSQIMGFMGQLGGRIALTYSELGADFGTTTFTAATYTHSTRTLAATGIGTAMTVPVTIWASSGTGVTAGQYRVASVTANSLVLSGAGLGAGADGSADVAGVKQNTTRGFGPQSSSGGDIALGQPTVLELNVCAYLSTYGSQQRAFEVPGQDARYARQGQVIVRNNTARQSGAVQTDGTNALPPPSRVDISQNLVDNTGTTEICAVQGTESDLTFLRADNNVYLSGTANCFQLNGVFVSFSSYKGSTGQEANSLNAGTPVYVNDGAGLAAWAVNTGVGTTDADLRNAIRGRAMGSWPSWADMNACAVYMMSQYAVTSGLAAVGTAPLNFYGAGSVDPAIY